MAFSSGTGIGVGFGAGNAGLGVAGSSGVGAGVGPGGLGASPSKGKIGTTPPKSKKQNLNLMNSLVDKHNKETAIPSLFNFDIFGKEVEVTVPDVLGFFTGLATQNPLAGEAVSKGLSAAFSATPDSGRDVRGFSPSPAAPGADGPGFFPRSTSSTFFPNGRLTADAAAPARSPEEAVIDAVEGELRALQGGENSAFLDSLALEAALADIERQRTEARADISRDQERRRIKGTPFANNLLAQSDREFEKQKAVVRAQAREAAIANMFRSIDLAFSQVNAGLNRELEELRIQTGANQATQAIAFSASQFEQEIAAREAAAEGAFFGSLASMLGQIIAGSQ